MYNSSKKVKGGTIMKKFVAGLVIGIGIASSFNVFAAIESLIGKEVQGEFVVKLDGKPIDNKAAVVDGSSYLPVRAIGEALGLNVDFQNNEVLVNQKKEEKPKVTDTTTDQTKPEMTEEERAKKITGLDNLIKSENEIIEMNQKLLDGFKQNPSDPAIKALEGNIAKSKDKIADLEKQKAELLIQK